MTEMHLKALADMTFMRVASFEKLVRGLGELLERKLELVCMNYRTRRIERLRANVLYYGLLKGDRTRHVEPL
jgi:hypothetical protein